MDDAQTPSQIRAGNPSDYPALLAIYNDAIAHSSATFEEQPLTLAELTERLQLLQLHFPLLVVCQQGKVVGYAYANHYKPRSAYRFCAETSIYLAPCAQGLGLGSRLYHALCQQLAQQGFTQLIAVVTSPNPSSDALHQRLGFQPAGFLSQVGFKFEQWYDVQLYQKTLDASQVNQRTQ